MKEFFRKWGQGIRDLSPAQQLHSQIIGTYGSIFGLIFAWLFMWLRGMWFFSFIMFFAIFIQIISLIGMKQKYAAIIKIQQEVEENGF